MDDCKGPRTGAHSSSSSSSFPWRLLHAPARRMPFHIHPRLVSARELDALPAYPKLLAVAELDEVARRLVAISGVAEEDGSPLPLPVPWSPPKRGDVPGFGKSRESLVIANLKRARGAQPNTVQSHRGEYRQLVSRTRRGGNSTRVLIARATRR